MEVSKNAAPPENMCHLHCYPILYFQLGEMTSYLHSRLSVLLTADMMKLVILIDYGLPKESWRNASAAGFWQRLLAKAYGSPFVNQKEIKAVSGREPDQGQPSRERPPTGPFGLQRTSSKGQTRRRKVATGSSGQRHSSPSRASTKRSGRRALNGGGEEVPTARSRPFGFLSYPVRMKWHKLEMLLRRNARGRNSTGARDLARKGFHGCVAFEILWDNVRGIGYTNELLADTCLSLEVSVVTKQEFGDIHEAHSWYLGSAYVAPDTPAMPPLGRQRSLPDRDRSGNAPNPKPPGGQGLGTPHQRGRHRRGWGGARRLSHGGSSQGGDTDESQALFFRDGTVYPYGGMHRRNIGWEGEWEAGDTESSAATSAPSPLQSERSGSFQPGKPSERRLRGAGEAGSEAKGGEGTSTPFLPPRPKASEGAGPGGHGLTRRPSRGKGAEGAGGRRVSLGVSTAAREAGATMAASREVFGASGRGREELDSLGAGSSREESVADEDRKEGPGGKPSCSAIVERQRRNLAAVAGSPRMSSGAQETWSVLSLRHLGGLFRCIAPHGEQVGGSLGMFLQSPRSAGGSPTDVPGSPLSPLGNGPAPLALARLPPRSPNRWDGADAGHYFLDRAESVTSTRDSTWETGAPTFYHSAPALMDSDTTTSSDTSEPVGPSPQGTQSLPAHLPSSPKGAQPLLPHLLSSLALRPRSSSLPSPLDPPPPHGSPWDRDADLPRSRACQVADPEGLKDVLIVLRFADPLLPLELRAIVTSDQKLLSMFESGIPPWAILLQSFPVTRRLYRSWMRPLSSLIVFVISLVTLVVGFYDLYKHVPILKEAVHSLMGPLFEWIEEWEMGSRLYYVASILFLQNVHKAFKWTMSVLHGLRIVLEAVLEPLHGPLLTLAVLLSPLGRALSSAATILLPLWHHILAAGEVLLPLWEAVVEIGMDVAEMFHVCVATVHSGLWLVGSAGWQMVSALWAFLAGVLNLLRAIFDLVVWPITTAITSVYTLVVGTAGLLYRVLESLWGLVAAPMHLLLGLLQMCWLGLCWLGTSCAAFWQSTGAAVHSAWETQAPVTRTVRATRDGRAASSVWLTVWNDLLTKLLRGLRFFLNGLLALIGSLNRHRLSLYNYATRRHALPARTNLSYPLGSGSAKSPSPSKLPTSYADRLYQQMSPHAQLVYRGRQGRERWGATAAGSIDDVGSDAASDVSIDDGSVMDGYRSEGGGSLAMDERDTGFKED